MHISKFYCSISGLQVQGICLIGIPIPDVELLPFRTSHKHCACVLTKNKMEKRSVSIDVIKAGQGAFARTVYYAMRNEYLLLPVHTYEDQSRTVIMSFVISHSCFVCGGRTLMTDFLTLVKLCMLSLNVLF
ncbi:hypothetical protein Droror1_Dr00000821 [Drosera rotundifolia]